MLFAIFGLILFFGLFKGGALQDKWWIGLLLMALWLIPAYFINRAKTKFPLQATLIQLTVGGIFVLIIFLIIGFLAYLYFISFSNKEKIEQEKRKKEIKEREELKYYENMNRKNDNN